MIETGTDVDENSVQAGSAMRRQQRSVKTEKKLRKVKPPTGVADISFEAAVTDVLRDTGIAATDWDLLLVGDGSGQSWDRPCGFGCLSLDRLEQRLQTWFGGFSKGSVAFAEGAAYLAPLEFFANKPRPAGEFVRAHIITDSQITADIGNNSELRHTVRKNRGLWHAIDSYAAAGFSLRWHWVRREVLAFNRVADYLSKLARQAVVSFEGSHGLPD